MNYNFLKALSLAALLSITKIALAADQAPPLPEPSATERVTYQDGRIEIYIGTNRSAAYAIGDSIPITVVAMEMPDAMYKAQHKAAPVLPPMPAQAAAGANPPAPDVAPIEEPIMLDIPMVSFQGLQMGVLSNQPSDVEMLSRAGPPVTYISPDGRRMVVTKFYVTTYVTPTKTQVAVKADFSYAIARQPDGQPDWIAAQTAELPVGITRSATTNQTRLIEGDFSPKISPLAQVTPWLLYRTWPLALPMVVALALMLRQRMTAEKVLSKNAKIWLIFNAVEADAAASGGYTNEHYRRILAALRDHLDVLGLDTTQTLVELKGRPELNAEAVDFVINREVLFFDPGSAISEEEHQKFMYSLKVLVPMPRQ